MNAMVPAPFDNSNNVCLCRFTLIWFTLFGITSVALTPNVKIAAVFSSNFYR